MATRRALGKGLSALMPSQGEVALRVSDIPIDQISANKYQPRTVFNADKIRELAESIKENGIIQPILLQKVGDKYEIIAGERRFRACKFLKKETIPAIIKSVQKKESLALALVENIQREELNPIEEAKAYKILMEEFDLTQEDVAKKVGRDRSSVANTLRLLKLPKDIQQDIEAGSLTMGHARAILACDTETAMLEMRKQILKYGLNVREVEAKARKRKSGKSKSKASPQDPFLRNFTETLQKAFSTKVHIKPNKKGGGVVTIEYYSSEDLERIIESV